MPLTAVALRRARSGLGAADIQIDDAGRMPSRQLPAVHLAREVAGLGEQWRRLHVKQPAADANAVVEPFGSHGLGGLARIARNRALVHVGDVGEIDQVVDDELIIRFHVQPAGSCRPLRLRQPRHVGNLGGIRLGRIAHPDPDDVPFFRNRIAAHLGVSRHLCLAWNLDALAVRCRTSTRDNRR